MSATGTQQPCTCAARRMLRDIPGADVDGLAPPCPHHPEPGMDATDAMHELTAGGVAPSQAGNILLTALVQGTWHGEVWPYLVTATGSKSGQAAYTIGGGEHPHASDWDGDPSESWHRSRHP